MFFSSGIKGGLNLEEFANILQLKECISLDEIKDTLVCNLNQDKILIIKKINKLDEIDELVYTLPQIKGRLQERMANKKNISEVKSSIPLSKFLWDLYIIGLHEYGSEQEKFNEFEVAKLQRNRFIARKIIIEYISQQELISQFNQLVQPERALDEILKSYVSHESDYSTEEIEILLRDINDILN